MADLKSGVEEVRAPRLLAPALRRHRRRGAGRARAGRRDARGRQRAPARAGRVYVSDFVDFALYLDADEADVRRWYLERFLALRNGAFQRPESYFHRYAQLSDTEAIEVAEGIWNRTNRPNLRDNIQPTRPRADLILEKGPDHFVSRILLRRA